jgi:hypothetical protein
MSSAQSTVEAALQALRDGKPVCILDSRCAGDGGGTGGSVSIVPSWSSAACSAHRAAAWGVHCSGVPNPMCRSYGRVLSFNVVQRITRPKPPHMGLGTPLLHMIVSPWEA